MSCDKCGASIHRDDTMNRRCDSCENLVRQCICPTPSKSTSDPLYTLTQDGIPAKAKCQAQVQIVGLVGGYFAFCGLEAHGATKSAFSAQDLFGETVAISPTRDQNGHAWLCKIHYRDLQSLNDELND
jgi:hypothetical protein